MIVLIKMTISVFLLMVDELLQGRAQITPEFDDVLVRRMVRRGKVESKEKLLIQFKSGVVIEEKMW